MLRSFLAIFPSFVCRSLKSAVPLFRCKDCALAHLVRQFFGFVVYSVAQGFCVFYVSPVALGWQIRFLCFFMLDLMLEQIRRLVRRLAHGWQIRRLVRRLAHGWQIRRCLQIFSAFQLDAGANANLFLSLFAKLRRDSR